MYDQELLEKTIKEFLEFNANRMKIWKDKPVIGALLNQGKFLGFGIRFYKEMPKEIEDCGMGISFDSIQVIGNGN